MGKRTRLHDRRLREGEKRLDHSRQGWCIENGRIVVGERRDWIGQLGTIRGKLVQAEGSESECGG